MAGHSAITRRTAGFPALVAAACLLLAACGGSPQAGNKGGAPEPGRERSPRTLPGVGAKMGDRVPAGARQAVVVYGRSARSASATVVLYAKDGKGWKTQDRWPAHNGRRGWTSTHREGDKKSPVGVFTLSDAGGVLPDPGAKLPYHASSAFTPPAWWPRGKQHDFDYVIAIDYNRVRGASPIDPRRPRGQVRGGGIWLHLDHGSGTSACVSLSKDGMRRLLRTLDPKLRPVIVMGDRARLAA